MRGDVLFWPSDGSLVSRVVVLATNGPFSHVSVDMGDGTDIGAHQDGGVTQDPLPYGPALTRWTPPPGSKIDAGIAFLKGELGNKYGWSNIANSALKLLHLPYRVSRTDRYDCSSLATRYLAVIGTWLGDDSEEPDSVSPNDLARDLHVI